MTAHTDVLTGLLGDLAAESADLDALLAHLPAERWAKPTPAEGWTIGHQIGHLTWTDEIALLAATDPAAFGEALRAAAAGDPLRFVDDAAAARAANPPERLLAEWRSGRSTLADALSAVPAGAKLPWFGPPMSAASMATARLMETWAHGQDVADALGVTRAPTARLRHVAHLGVRTRDFAYLLHDRTPPTAPFRVDLLAPDGVEHWTWGPDDAAQRVTGPALDFCLLVTQRRHRADLDVRAEGADADAWLDIAQAFAGAPGPGRPAAAAPAPRTPVASA
ncbi:TIGR03084 family metal-binding protein [Jatrophihabitans sp. YIM 134969]